LRHARPLFASLIVTCSKIFAAPRTIAVAQNDIKKVLAYSTVSQLGYMFAAVGLGAYVAGAFHLVTHAFFKALLFLGAGSVIHGLNGEQDLRKMGGLAYKMPITATTMWIGGLGLAGAPPLAGFFSKDEILAAALDGRHTPIFLLLLFLVGVGPLLPWRRATGEQEEQRRSQSADTAAPADLETAAHRFIGVSPPEVSTRFR
jgi:NADH-quinone oxidoreductase subunit L